MRPGCWRWNNISLPFPELHSIDSIALGLVIYNAKTVPASAGRRKMALYFHISFHDVQVSSQHYYSLNIAQRMYCLFFQRSVHSYHHLLHCHHLYSIHEGEWNRVCGKFLFPSHLVMFRQEKEQVGLSLGWSSVKYSSILRIFPTLITEICSGTAAMYDHEHWA